MAYDASNNSLEAHWMPFTGNRQFKRDPRMIVAAEGSLRDNPNPSEAEIREGLKGNVCRCTGYQNIVKAILASADMMNAQKEAAE